MFNSRRLNPGCDEVYADRRSLKEHESSHLSSAQDSDYECDEENCGKTYSSPKALRNHKRVNHEDDLQVISCDICNTSLRKADLQEHLEVSTGPIDSVPHQPLKGRKRGGVVRFGEMERDALIAHGTSLLLQDRLMHCSDKSVSLICRTATKS